MVTRRSRSAVPPVLFGTLLFGIALCAWRSAACAPSGRSRELGRDSVAAWDRPQVLAALYLGQFVKQGVPNRITVKENPAGSGVPLFEVDFVTDWPTSPRTVLTYPEGYSYLAMCMMDGDMVLTAWSSASEGVVQVFHLVKGGAKLVLEKSGWATVEHWHDSLLITQSEADQGGKYRYTTSQIWRWGGQNYKLAATVPYARRLLALAKLEHEVRRK